MVITLCGSTRFRAQFEEMNKKLTLEGHVVLSVGVFGHFGDKITEHEKNMLDMIHKKKIDMSDAIYVLNVGGYIGESTWSEIEYAKQHNKKVFYLEEKHVISRR